MCLDILVLVLQRVISANRKIEEPLFIHGSVVIREGWTWNKTGRTSLECDCLSNAANNPANLSRSNENRSRAPNKSSSSLLVLPLLKCENVTGRNKNPLGSLTFCDSVSFCVGRITAAQKVWGLACSLAYVLLKKRINCCPTTPNFSERCPVCFELLLLHHTILH